MPKRCRWYCTHLPKFSTHVHICIWRLNTRQTVQQVRRLRTMYGQRIIYQSYPSYQHKHLCHGWIASSTAPMMHTGRRCRWTRRCSFPASHRVCLTRKALPVLLARWKNILIWPSSSPPEALTLSSELYQPTLVTRYGNGVISKIDWSKLAPMLPIKVTRRCRTNWVGLMFAWFLRERKHRITAKVVCRSRCVITYSNFRPRLHRETVIPAASWCSLSTHVTRSVKWSMIVWRR